MTAEEAFEQSGFNGHEWQRSKVAGEHHHFRTHFTCPLCNTSWVQDFTDTSSNTWLDPVKLGLSLLCGGCESRRRLIYVERSGNRVLWFAPYFTPQCEAKAWAVIRDPVRIHSLALVKDHGPWIEADAPRPRWRDPRLKDDKRAALTAIMRPHLTKGNEMTLDEAKGHGWYKPPPPVGYKAMAVPGMGHETQGEGKRYD